MISLLKIVNDLYNQHLNGLHYQTLLFNGLINIVLIQGSFKLITIISSLTYCLWKRLIRPIFQSKTRMYDRYHNGIDTWAVITGASDGIGLAMAHNLAQQGFNICIVARNESKMKHACQQVQNTNPDIKTMYIIADFAELKTIQQYRTVIADKLKDKDVGMLLLNAGWGFGGLLQDFDDSELERIINVNGIHVPYLFKCMLNQMMNRPNRSATIVTSSVAAQLQLSYLTFYSATKLFVSHMSRCMNVQLKQKMDVMTWEPGYVKTKMTKLHHGKAVMSSPEEAVQSCFRDVGYDAHTHGCLGHEITSLLVKSLPSFLLNARNDDKVFQHMEHERNELKKCQ